MTVPDLPMCHQMYHQKTILCFLTLRLLPRFRLLKPCQKLRLT